MSLSLLVVCRLVDKKNARRYDDCITYTFVASRKALKQAGLDKDQDSYQNLNKQKVGVLVGSGMGGLTVFQDNVTNMMEKGVKKVSPFFIPYAITNMWALSSFHVHSASQFHKAKALTVPQSLSLEVFFWLEIVRCKN